MKNKRIKSFLVLFLLISSFANAQDAVKPQQWTLEQCIDYALKNNIQVQQSQLNTDLSKVNLTQSEANLLPSLNANASHAYNFGRTVDRFTNQFATKEVLSENLSLSSNINIFSGWQNINSIQQNRFNLVASKFDVDKMKNDISLNIASAYLQILFNMESLDNARNQLGVTNSQVERTKKLYDAGATAKGTLLDIQSQLALEELNVTNAQNQLDISYLTLVQLLNIQTPEGFSVVKPDLAIANEALLAANPFQIYNTAVTNLPEVKSAELKVKSAEKGVKIAWGGVSPSLSFSAGYGTGYSGASQQIITQPGYLGYRPDGRITSAGDTVLSPTFSNPVYEKTPFRDQYKNNVNKSFGFYLTVPLFNRFQTKTMIDKARIQKLNADLTVELTKLQLQKSIQQAYADANASLKKYGSTQKALDAMQESFKYTEQKFNVGMVNTLDYSTAKNKLIKTQSDLLEAKYEYVFKTKVLDFYQGKPLKF